MLRTRQGQGADKEACGGLFSAAAGFFFPFQAYLSAFSSQSR